MIIFICQDGVNPSGVATCGYHVLKLFPSARMVLLNADKFPVAAPKSLHQRIVRVGEAQSHSAQNLKKIIARLVGSAKGQVVLMPNTGDTPWLATSEYLRTASASILKRIRVLGIVHSDMESQYSLAEHHLPIAPLWIGVSRRCAEVLRRRIGAGRTRMLSCPVEVPVALALRRKSKAVRLAYVGRLEEPQKKISRLLELFKELSRLKINFTATVAGDGPAAKDFRKGIAALPRALKKRIRLPGALSRQQIDTLWARHDVFLLVSAYEGLPLALLEAMAAAVCPVAMQVSSGLPDLLKDRRNARLAPQGNVKKMAAVIAELASDPAQIKKIGLAARADVENRFSTQNYFKELSAIISHLQKLPPARPAKVKPDETMLAVARLVKKLRPSKLPVVIYGAGMFGRKVLDACLEQKIKVRALIDSDPTREGLKFSGVKCFSPADIARFPQCAFAVGSLAFAGEISKRIRDAFTAAELKTPSALSVSLR